MLRDLQRVSWLNGGRCGFHHLFIIVHLENEDDTWARRYELYVLATRK